MGSDVVVAWPDGLVAAYRAHYAALVRLGYLLTGSNDCAEEIVQEAFIRVQRKTDVEDLAAYLRAAVVNGCRDHLRRAAVQRRAAPRLVTPDSVVDVVDELSDALARLPERQRAVIVLRYYLRLSEAEIAALLGCRPGTVKSLAHRGLAALRGVLGP